MIEFSIMEDMMISFRKAVLFIAATILFCTIFTQEALAISSRGGGGGGALGGLTGTMGLSFGFAYTSTDQVDMNGAIDDANTANAGTGGISTKPLNGTYELFASWIYRFDRTSYAMVVRPSYVWQKSSGSSAGGSYDYGLSGFSVFPMLRIYPLENSFIHFYMQGGLGYGSLSGDITAAATTAQFKGSAFGAIGGIGVDFCFTDAHCLTVEGNLRYLPIERNLTSGGNCSTTQTIPGISQCGGGTEVERNGNDLKTSMSGVQGVLAYTLNF